jgi:hypothetical protein
METFYDGYVVNTIIDACYRSAESKKWEPVNLKEWRGGKVNEGDTALKDYDPQHLLIKEEKMSDGRLKIILKDKNTGKITQIIK